MNFYEHQDRARRRSFWLAASFVAAVIAIVTALNAVAYCVWAANAAPAPGLRHWLERPYWAWISAATLLVLLGGSAWTSLRLRGGGPALARMLRARQVQPASANPQERRLLNVVEEMSIASGVPVPALYVLDHESGINAFVAGTRATETVMVVTRGALETFSRDELQGVVGHEYSHILNHDMSLNIRLMGVLAGLVVIAQAGRFLLRSGSHARSRDTAQLVFVGIAILAIGYLGSLLASLIKAAISRQREFLADASSVQFTRNPDGIANALYRIQQHTQGSLLMSAHAEDISHFCFGESVHYLLSGLLATHPPLEQRIRAIKPGFTPPARETTAAFGHQPPAAAARAQDPATTSFDAAPAAFDGAAVAAAVGTVAPAQLDYAQAYLAALPAPVTLATHVPERAAALVFALLLRASASASRAAILDIVSAAGPPFDAAAVVALSDALAGLPNRRRLPLVYVALPALKLNEPAIRARFLAVTRAISAEDRHYTVFEFALARVLDHFLGDHLAGDATRRARVRYFRFEAVADDLRLLLSVLAQAGTATPEHTSAAFAAAWLPFRLPGALLPREACRLSDLNGALGRLAALSPLLKQHVIRACADCVIHDATVNADEEELLAAIAISLDCPLPPLVLA